MSSKIKPALLITDMQKGCVEKKDEIKIFPDRRKVINNLKKLATVFRERGHPVIFSVIEHEPDGTTLPIGNKEVWSAKGSEDAQVLEELRPQSHDILVPKTRLSAFFETDLENILKKLSVNMVVLTGYQLSICVYATALDSYQMGFWPKVVTDASLDINERRFNDFSKCFDEFEYSILTERVISNILHGWS